MMADGTIQKKYVALTLAERDGAHIEKFRSFLGSGHKITIIPAHTRAGKNNTATMSMRVHSQRIVDDLGRHGVVPRKTYIAQALGLESDRDFWRGVIDGDGCLGIYRNLPRISLVGSHRLLAQFRDYCTAISGVVPVVSSCGKYAQIGFSGRRAVQVIRVLYTDAAVALDRKAEKAREILSHVTSLSP